MRATIPGTDGNRPSSATCRFRISWARSSCRDFPSTQSLRSSLLATLSPAEALEKAKAAAEAARQAAEAAQGYAGQASEALGHALSTATGGTVDPTVFRLAIFVLA